MTEINPDDPRDLVNYWQLGMHDNGEIITSITFSFDRSFLFSSGEDGNLFQYKWNGDKVSRDVAPHPWIPIEELPDDDAAGDEELLSSEEEKRKRNADERHLICDVEKKKVITVLEEYKERFSKIWEQNESLSESQRLPEEAFELDQRITEDLNSSIERRTKTAQREMEYDVEKVQIAVKKLKSYFTDCLDLFPVKVLGIG